MPKKKSLTKPNRESNGKHKRRSKMVLLDRIRQELAVAEGVEKRERKRLNLQAKAIWTKHSAEMKAVLDSSKEMTESMAKLLAKSFAELFHSHRYNRQFVSKVVLFKLGQLIRMAANDQDKSVRGEAAVLVTRLAEMATQSLRFKIRPCDAGTYLAKKQLLPVMFSPNPTLHATNDDAEKLFKRLGVGSKLMYRRDSLTRFDNHDDITRVVDELVKAARARLNLPFCKKNAEQYRIEAIEIFKKVKGDVDPGLLALAKKRHPSRRTVGMIRQSLLLLIDRTVRQRAAQFQNEDGWTDTDDHCQP